MEKDKDLLKELQAVLADLEKHRSIMKEVKTKKRGV